MADEELYEKWRNENSRIDRHTASPTRIGHKHIHWNNGVDRRKAFLDGLEEGRKSKWHDLRKDPSDLPTKENAIIRCVLNNGNEVICETEWYPPTEDEIGYGKLIIQFYCNEDWIDTNDVKVWCELSKFEES